MTIVKLGVDKAWRVIATNKGGNLDLEGGSDITFDASASESPGWVRKFKVTFKDSETQDPTWPFTKKVNGDDAPDDHFEVLELERGKSIARQTRVGGLRMVKYDVAADGNPPGPETEVIALDPTIIIRPAKNQLSRTLFGAICAGLGAVVSALVTAWWLLR